MTVRVEPYFGEPAGQPRPPRAFAGVGAAAAGGAIPGAGWGGGGRDGDGRGRGRGGGGGRGGGLGGSLRAPRRRASGESMAARLGLRGGDWYRLFIQYAPILAVTLLAKLALPPLGKIGLGIDLPIVLGITLLGLATARFVVHVPRLMLYLLMLGGLGGAQLLRDETFSPTSIALLATLFLPLTLQLKPVQPGTPASPYATDGAVTPLDQALRTMSNLALVFAICGVLQFSLQYVIGVRNAFPIETFVPDAFTTHKYNHLIPIRDGAQYLKTNGVFFLEPSFYSQFIALGLLLELSRRYRPLRIAVMAAALAMSYSGTGLVVATVGITALIVLKRRWGLIVFAIMVAITAILLADVLHLNHLFARIGEFQSNKSSASARFMAWTDMLQQHWWGDASRMLFGAGAGSFSSYAVVARLATAEMSFSKMLFEYGIVGFVLFFGFFIYCLNSVRAPLAFRLGLCAALFLNGAFAIFPVGIAVSVLLWPPALAPRPEPAFLDTQILGENP